MKISLRAGEFTKDAWNRMPVAQLRIKYPKEEMQSLLSEKEGLSVHDALLELCGFGYRPISGEWSFDYFTWILEVAALTPTYVQWTERIPLTEEEIVRFGVTPQYHYDGTKTVAFDYSLVDWVCMRSTYLADPIQILNYLLSKGFYGFHGLGWCLAFQRSRPTNHRLSKRLLDAGADLFWLRDDSPPEFAQWHASRQRCRAACLALLASWHHGPRLRRWMPRDVVRMMAQRLWAYRWVF